jgi:hypothetical protein
MFEQLAGNVVESAGAKLVCVGFERIGSGSDIDRYVCPRACTGIWCGTRLYVAILRLQILASRRILQGIVVC